MLNHKNQKLFIGLVGIVFLVIGISVGNVLSANLKLIDLEAIIIGLILTNTILILILGGLIAEIREAVEYKKRSK